LSQETECRLTVFWNEMQVIPTDDDSSVHFGGHNAASKDTATDRNFTGEGTFLVCGDLVST
jgi:hypothetical protein